jgi:multiple sugar transport system substrate-binding protein
MSEAGIRTRRAALAGAATAAAGGVLAAAGCGLAPAPAAPAAAPRAVAAATVVVYSNWTTGARGEYMKWLKAAFEAEAPGLTMQLEFVAGGGPPATNEFLIKLYAMIASATMPDLAMMWGRDSCHFMNKGAFLDLTRSLQAAKWPWDRFLTADPASFQDQGKTYGLPHMYTTPVLAANMGLFAKAGVPYPRDTWTWNDFLQTARALTREGQWGFQQPYVGGNPVEGFAYWVWASGGEVIDARRAKSRWDLPESIEGMRFVTDLRHKHGVALPEDELQTLRGANVDPFLAGKVAMFHGNVGAFGNWLTLAPDLDWDLLPFPVSPRGKRTVWHSQSGYYIAHNTRVPDQAFRTLTFLMSEKAMNELGRTRATMPSLKSAAYDASGWLRPPPKHVRLSVDVLSDSQPQPWAFPKSVDWYAAVMKELDAAGRGERSADEACRAATQQGDLVLKAG